MAKSLSNYLTVFGLGVGQFDEYVGIIQGDPVKISNPLLVDSLDHTMKKGA